MTNWTEYRERLAANLADHPAPRELKNERDFNSAVSSLTQALQDTIEEVVPLSKPEVVPLSKPVPHSRWWWNPDLKHLKKEKNRLNHLSYLHRACTDHPSHSERRDICTKYATAIQEAKSQHWEEYLEDLNEDLLWGANRYILAPAGDRGKARVPTLSVKSDNGSIMIAETNEEQSKVLACTFFPLKPPLPSDYSCQSYPERVSYKFHLDLDQLCCQVTKLGPYKAPGPDGIPNVVLKEAIDVIDRHLLQIY